MTDRKQIGKLAELAALVRDQRLELLRLAAERKATTERLIAGLDQPGTDSVPAVAAARAELAYRSWADQRRRELSRLLAAQLAECEKRRDAARLAFGRAEVLDKLRNGKK
ncbi:MAG: hypothetical protein JNN06_04050 [Gemmobacter sp.]|uniref:hypothetical protein n=1 Tax=Gemmobacter sp. TaxID=1898957 RepID=UPI001A63FDA7|nr:hypothetical protein [Gemmobacter sp.]MBL8561433.1 hypothetical protein [Gemmobacter sp.]